MSHFNAVYVFALICAWVVQENEAQSDPSYGETASIEDYPFFASVAGCGGAIVSEKYIITSADCAYNRSPSSSNVYVGGDDMEEVEVRSVTIHEDYGEDGEGIKRNNIAMLRLENELEFTDKIQAATLPDEAPDDETGYYYLLSGDEKLQYRLGMRRYRASSCIEYQDIDNPDPESLDKEIFCSVRGDGKFKKENGLCPSRIRGCPIVQDDVLRGIHAFGFDVENCEDPDTYFVDVEYYNRWIRRIMRR